MRTGSRLCSDSFTQTGDYDPRVVEHTTEAAPAIALSPSSDARVNASRVSAAADQQTQIDVSTFIACADAYASDDERLAQRAKTAGLDAEAARQSTLGALAWILTLPVSFTV